MGLPLEKTLQGPLGLCMRMKQVFDPTNIGLIDPDTFYFIQVPLDPSYQVPEALREKLPLMIPVHTPGWYFIHTRGRTWEEHLASLKPSHAKKLRRYSRKPQKYRYTVTVELPRTFAPERLQRCYELLMETMANNLDADFYSWQSFVRFMHSVPDGVFVATHDDGRVLGFHSGAVVGHDHSEDFRSWGVYHNLFMEYAKREFRRGTALVDLGNTNDDFKRELGGQPQIVSFELRSGFSWRSALGLASWAVGSLVPEDSWVRRTIRNGSWALWALGVIVIIAVLAGLRLLPLLGMRLLNAAVAACLCGGVWVQLRGTAGS